jgi:hypothetical protein
MRHQIAKYILDRNIMAKEIKRFEKTPLKYILPKLTESSYQCENCF